MTNKLKRPNGPRNLKAGGFTNGLWRLEERAARLAKLRADRELPPSAAACDCDPDLPSQLCQRFINGQCEGWPDA